MWAGDERWFIMERRCCLIIHNPERFTLVLILIDVTLSSRNVPIRRITAWRTYSMLLGLSAAKRWEQVKTFVTNRACIAGTFRKSANIVSRVVADEAIVVPIRRGAADTDAIFTFNEAGTALWNMVEADSSCAEMRAYLQREYAISAEQAAQDTEDFIADLASAGLIEAY